MDFSIIIPYKKNKGIREKNFQFVQKRYKKLFPDTEIILGEDDSGEQTFCRSHAINNGVKRSNSDILVISDGDLLIQKQRIIEGIGLLERKPFVIPFGVCGDLTEEKTLEILRKNRLSSFSEMKKHVYAWRDIRQNKLAGGIQITTKEFFDKIGGYDTRFIGWGYEDTYLCQKIKHTLGDYPILPENLIYHLYHPRDMDFYKNKPLYKQLVKELRQKE